MAVAAGQVGRELVAGQRRDRQRWPAWWPARCNPYCGTGSLAHALERSHAPRAPAGAGAGRELIYNTCTDIDTLLPWHVINFNLNLNRDLKLQVKSIAAPAA
eukprot:SAG22_NODE_437_length_10501_cov_3.019804_10_plen_102_part_00